MRVGGAGHGGTGLVPFGAGAAGYRSREEIDPVGPSAGARPDMAGGAHGVAGRRLLACLDAPRAPQPDDPAAAARTVGGRVQPSVAFLAQFIAQERLGRGLELDKAADGTLAYRRAGAPALAIRVGATIDQAA